ncbi:MAG: flagellar biosynthetic protein FliO [Lachnospiraceae bacterium]|nr:flagellar biosynthetic protein FliO [Lachnospiraceae bacterium]
MAAGGGGSIVELLTVLIIFVFVLFLTVYVTRFVAGFEKNRMKGSNIEVIEAQRFSRDKYIMIVRTGSRFLAVAVSKNDVTLLCELEEESIRRSDDNTPAGPSSFGNLLQKAKEHLQKAAPKK